ncbi:MAG: DUF1439 domain-containing protein [Verrucomicrobiota bacterium]
MNISIRLLVGLVLVAVAFALTGCGGGIQIRIPKEVIEKAVTGKFPTIRSRGVMSVTLSNPKLDFKGSRNRLGVEADCRVRFLGLVPMSGDVICDGSLEYKPRTGAFHFTDVEVQDFNIKGLPKSKFDEFSGLIGTAVVKTLGGLEIYKLDSKDRTESLAKATLKSIRVTDDGVVATLSLLDNL